MTRAWVAALLLLTGAVIVAQEPAGQQPSSSAQPPLVFRSEVNYVEVDATVTDAQGNPVTDLTRADFEVLEDGKPQAVASFAHVDLPIRRAERPLFTSAVEHDVQTNANVEGRIYLFVLDDLHTDVTRTPRVKAAARRFVEENVGVNDVAAVVFTGRNDASQDFTNNPRLLLAAIDRFVGRKLTSATLNQLTNPVVNQDGSVGPGEDIDKQERAFRARSAMGSIRKLSEFMAGVHGRRKAMLLISEGIDYDIHAVMGEDGSTASIVLEDTRNAVGAATRGNVAIYTIDPRGLANPADELLESASTFAEQGVGLASLQSAMRLSQDSLRVLAADTGGFAAVNQNDFDTAFTRIVRENSSYYLLGYYPSNDKRDGKFRRLQVRVKRPGLTVRSRSGYLAPRGKAPASPAAGKDAPPLAVTEALGSPLPVSGVPLRVFAAPFKGSGQKAVVAYAIEVEASRFDFANENGAWVERLEVLNTALESGGKTIPGDRQKLNLALKPDTYERVRRHGLRIVGQTDLPPGRYQLRFAVGNAGGTAGSVLYDLEIPDFSKPPLALSGVAVTSAGAEQVATVRSKNPLGDYLAGPPVATREFRQGDALTLFVEVYDNVRGAQAHQVAITAQLRSDDGRVITQTAEQRSSTELEGTRGGYGFAPRLSLQGIPTGIYVIHVEAEARIGGVPAVTRDIQIRVIP